jgi:hypothetical protein
MSRTISGALDRNALLERDLLPERRRAALLDVAIGERFSGTPRLCRRDWRMSTTALSFMSSRRRWR